MSPSRDAARVALVGYGMGGSLFHAPFIDAEPRLELAAVVTGSSERQAEVATRYPGARLIGNIEEAMDQVKDVDLVVVSTPNASHAVVAEAVLRQSRPVVVDKPVTPSSEETRRLATLARDVGTAVVPYQNRRWDGDFRTIVDLLGQDALGALHSFESRYERWRPQVAQARTWKNDPEPGAGNGIVFDLGTHVIDQAVALFGRPEAVDADIATRRPGSRVNDDAFVALLYPGGPRVHLWTSAVAPDLGPRFRLLGSAAAYVKWGMDVQESWLAEGRSPRESGWGEEPESCWGNLVAGDERRPVPTLPGSYGLFYAGMASFLLDGASPPVDIADAIVTAEVIEAALTSSASGVAALLP
jgi:scyllo-inositol 2-dehydrogenase (NADP+)